MYKIWYYGLTIAIGYTRATGIVAQQLSHAVDYRELSREKSASRQPSFWVTSLSEKNKVLEN